MNEAIFLEQLFDAAREICYLVDVFEHKVERTLSGKLKATFKLYVAGNHDTAFEVRRIVMDHLKLREIDHFFEVDTPKIDRSNGYWVFLARGV
jgi:hypothetical protein